MWGKDFVKTTKTMSGGKKLVRDFDDVWSFAKSIADQIEIKILNSGTDDELDYSDPPKRYIVIGGARLSRGLTLQGLSVSVFLRDSTEYDTLLQMGRWFGYRRGYEDLTRIYVSIGRAEDFASLARVEQEMREDLSQYAKEPNPPSPRDVMPRIRSHNSLAVTSAMKMGAGQSQNISFAGQLAQTVALPLDEPAWLKDNELVARKWVESLGAPDKATSKKGSFYWTKVEPAKILEFLNDYRFSRYAYDITGSHLSRYIKFQNKNGELLKWDVVIPKGSEDIGPYKWTDNLTAHRVKRALRTRRSIRVLSDKGNMEQWIKALDRDPKDRKRGVLFLQVVDGNELRKDALNRFSEKLTVTDLVGIVIKFPESKSVATAAYVGQPGGGVA